MDKTISAQSVQAEYATGKAYKARLNLYDQVKTNENFYLGRQWEGLKTRSIMPVTLNFLRRVTSYFQSMIISDDFAIDIRPFREDQNSGMIAQILENECESAIERAKIKTLNRTALRDCVVDGDAYLYYYYDPEVETGQLVPGEIAAETLMNTNVHFGNPYSADLQKQPYILVVRRRPLETVRREAEENGVQNADTIQAENESDFVGEDNELDNHLVTEITRFWKAGREKDAEESPGKKTVHMMTVCGDVVTREETDTGMTLYPIASMSWEQQKNCYHGVSPITEVINTQITVNKMLTAISVFTQKAAFPKVIYNAGKFPHGYDGSPEKAIAVQGDVREAIMTTVGGAQLPTTIVNIFDMIITKTRDFMGASDSALGNIKPDNTSAIVATQQATSAPLVIQKLAFKQFVEDQVRIILDMMLTYYGIRTMCVDVETVNEQTGQKETRAETQTVNFDEVTLYPREVNVEVGESSYWSELTTIQTADNFFAKGLFSDFADYVETLPERFVPGGKKRMLDKLRERAKLQAAQNVQPAQVTTGQTAETPMTI